MSRIERRRRLGQAVVIGLVLLVLPSLGLAGGSQSNELAGRGGPVADSARGVVANPAAIGPVEGISTDFDLQVEWRRQAHTRDTTFDGDDGTSFDSVKTSTVRAFPTFAYSSKLGIDWLTLGFALSVPWRYASSWPTDGPQRYHSIFLQSTGIALTPALTFSPLDWLHVGGSLSYNLVEYESYRAADVGKIVARREGVDPSTVPGGEPGNEGREHLEFSEGAVRGAVGVTLTPGDVRIGAAYHSRVSLELDGTYELLIPDNDVYQRRFGGDVERQATFETSRPSIVRFGVAWSPDERFNVYGHGEWTRWSTVDNIELDISESGGGVGGSASDGGGSASSGDNGEGAASKGFGRKRDPDWRDTFGLRLGGRYRLTDSIDLDGEIGVETSAIPEERLNPRLLDASKINAAVGARWRVDDAVSFRLGYQHVQHVTRTVRETELEPPPTGDYRQWIGIVETGFSYHFR